MVHKLMGEKKILHERSQNKNRATQMYGNIGQLYNVAGERKNMEDKKRKTFWKKS